MHTQLYKSVVCIRRLFLASQRFQTATTSMLSKHSCRNIFKMFHLQSSEFNPSSVNDLRCLASCETMKLFLNQDATRSSLADALANWQHDVLHRYQFFETCKTAFAFPMVHLEQQWKAQSVPSFTYLVGEPEKNYQELYRRI